MSEFDNTVNLQFSGSKRLISSCTTVEQLDFLRLRKYNGTCSNV